MGRAAVTIRDVARAAGVSVATVSRVLSGSEQVIPETKKRVLEAVENLKYIPNFSARTIASHKSNLAGLVVDTPFSPYMSEIISHVEKALYSRNYDLILCGAYYDQEREERLINSLISRQVDGLILTTGRPEYSDMTRDLLERVPTVMIGKSQSFDGHPCITADYHQGGIIGTQYLIDLGHRKIVFLGRRAVSTSQKLRADGYMEVCTKQGIEPIFWDNQTAENSVQKGYEMAIECLKTYPEISAIFAASDSLAVGTIKAADELGLKIPDDLSILGFDDTYLASIPRINLTTMNQPKQQMAELAVETLINIINSPDEKNESKMLTPVLIRRETCGFAPKR